MFMKLFLSILLAFISASGFCQKNPALAKTLEQMAEADQMASGLPPDGISIGAIEWIIFKDSIYQSNYDKTRKIFERVGFPGYDLVGKQGSFNFWLIVQHLDKWPKFQDRVLKAMKKQVSKNNASPGDFAYLTDRVRLNQGRKQIYGTQVEYDTNTCKAYPPKLIKPGSVNSRRHSVGLSPLEVYLNEMGKSHFMMNREIYEKKGIKGPWLYPLPK